MNRGKEAATKGKLYRLVTSVTGAKARELWRKQVARRSQ